MMDGDSRVSPGVGVGGLEFEGREVKEGNGRARYTVLTRSFISLSVSVTIESAPGLFSQSKHTKNSQKFLSFMQTFFSNLHFSSKSCWLNEMNE